MENKGNTRRIRKAAWATFVLPFMAVGASPLHEDAAFEEVAEPHQEKLYGDAAPRDPYPYYGYAAQSADYYEQPDFVVDYFRNLTEHFPTNNCGNCGYTAATMLLSYYDTYWNGDIIPDRFNSDPAMIGTIWNRDYCSPGVNDFAAPIKFDESVPEPGKNASQKEKNDYNAYLAEFVYSPYLEEMEEQEHIMYNMMSYLYHIALGYNSQFDEDGKPKVIWHFGAKEPTPGLNGDSLRELMNLYFAELGLSGWIEAKTIDYADILDCSTEGENRQELRRMAIERLNQGQPIIYMGDLLTKDGYYDDDMSYIDGSGHIAVAYWYDKGCDQIIGHLGWKGENREYSMASFDKTFGDFDAFLYLDVKEGLGFTEWNRRFHASGPLSACDLSAHWHADDGHRAKIYYGDDEFHALQCICGDVRYERHLHDGLVPFDEQNHALKCACGDAIYEQHTCDSTVFSDPSRHAYVCRCGETIGYGFHYYIQRELMKFVCIGCGDVRYVDPPFVYNP